MTEPNGARYQAWRDGLPQDEREFAELGEGMPPEMAAPFIAVELRRELRSELRAIHSEIAALNRPLWRQVLGPLTVLAAVVGALLGIPRLGG